MWDRLRKQVETERELLNRLVETHRPLLSKSTSETPDAIELSALAAMLHSFYTGILNMLKRVAVEVDGKVPSGVMWHRDLLEALVDPNESRPRVISDELYRTLREYLAFRHVFRSAYAFDLRWDKMRKLVLECEATLRRVEDEVDRFLTSAS